MEGTTAAHPLVVGADNPTAPRIECLDGLRGLAVLMVLIYHGVLPAGAGGESDRAVRLAAFGWTGVDLFFVLSGFLITGILLDSRKSEHYLSRFYVRRALRIFPLYYSAILFLLYVAPAAHVFPAEELAQMRHYQAFYWTYTVNLFYVLHPSLGIMQGTAHLWSLAIEEHFYMVWPFVVARLDIRQLRWVSCAIVLGAFALRVALSQFHLSGSYTLTPTRIDALALGALLVTFVRDPQARPLLRAWLPRVGVGCAIAIMTITYLHQPREFVFWDPNTEVFGFTAVDGLAAAIIGGLVLAPDGSRTRRLFEARPLRWFGRYSYGLYVVHFPIMHALKRAAETSPRVPVGELTTPIGRALFLVTSILASIAVARLSWALIEAPFLRLKRLFPSENAHAAVRA